MAYVIIDSEIGNQPIATVDTVQRHVLGTRVDIFDPLFGFGKAMYVAFPASTALAAGSLVMQQTAAGTAVPFTMVASVNSTLVNSGIPVYVAPTAVASVAAIQYGWVIAQGITPVLKTAVAFVPTSKIFLSATAGRIFPTATAGAQVMGAQVVSASVASGVSVVNVYVNDATMQTQIT